MAEIVVAVFGTTVPFFGATVPKVREVLALFGVVTAKMTVFLALNGTVWHCLALFLCFLICRSLRLSKLARPIGSRWEWQQRIENRWRSHPSSPTLLPVGM